MKGPIPALIASAALAALSAVTIWAQAVVGEPVALLVLDLVSTVVATALVPLVLRRPVPGAVALALLAGVSSAVTPQATAGALFVALQCRLPLALGVGLVGLAAHAMQGWWRPHGGLSYGWWLVLLAASYAALIAWGAFWRANRSLMESLRDRARRAEAEQARRVAEARVRERARIAYEMHDVLAHRLTLLATYAGAVEYRPDATPGQVARAAAVVRESAHQALHDLREVIALLRGDDDEDHGRPQPSLADIPRLLDESRAAGVTVALDDQVSGATSLPAATQRTAFRVVQEAVTNARRHAAGAPVWVRLTGAPGDRLRVEIRNPVPPRPGIAAAGRGGGSGLAGLAERVRLGGGELDYAATDGGFQVRAWLPWPA